MKHFIETGPGYLRICGFIPTGEYNGSRYLAIKRSYLALLRGSAYFYSMSWNDCVIGCFLLLFSSSFSFRFFLEPEVSS